MLPTDVLDAVLDGTRTPTEVASRCGVDVAVVAEALAARHRAQRAARRRRVAAAALASCLALGLVGRVAFSQATCMQTLPAPLVTFCPDAPALASEVNGNFAGVLSILNARVGPDAGIVSVNAVESRTAATPLTLQPSGGTTRVGGTLQLANNTTTPCDATTVGSVRVRAASLEYCVAGAWRTVLAGNPANPSSCQTLLTASPGLPSGTYTLTAGGYTFQTECDMTSAGGGWTLIQGHTTQVTLESLGVSQTSGTYLPAAAVRQLAANATQVRFTDPTGTATSNSNGQAINQLRNLLVLNLLNDVAAWTFTGSLNATHFASTCPSVGTYPDLVHMACNSAGAHVFAGTHTLRSSAPIREPVAVWVR